MINADNQIKFAGPSIDNPESWLPVFGKWCGPGWTAGRRANEIKASPSLQQSCTDDDIHSIDKLCCIHDEAYEQAAGQSDETVKKLKADVILIESLNQLDQSTLSQAEKLYITAMRAVFAIKIGFAKSTLDTLEANTLLQEAMKALNSDVKKKIDAFFAERVKAIPEEFLTLEQQLNTQKPSASSPSSRPGASQRTFTQNHPANEWLRGMLY